MVEDLPSVPRGEALSDDDPKRRNKETNCFLQAIETLTPRRYRPELTYPGEALADSSEVGS